MWGVGKSRENHRCRGPKGLGPGVSEGQQAGGECGGKPEGGGPWWPQLGPLGKRNRGLFLPVRDLAAVGRAEQKQDGV